MKISDFTTLTFDCYGTLIDWESGIYSALQPLFKSANFSADKESTLAQYSQTEARIQAEQPNLPYSDLLRLVHETMADSLGIRTSKSEHRAFADSIRNWLAFSDSAPSLHHLQEHFKLVILSNVDRRGFALSNKYLQVEFDAIFTAEDIGAYKPSPGNFQYMLDQLESLGIPRSEILHVAQSLFHDMVPATGLGLATCWIDRRAGQPGSGATPLVENPPKTDMRFISLADMVRAHRLELQ